MKKIYSYLFEQEEKKFNDPTENNVSFKKNSGTKASQDSVDDQIDSLILMYESKSIRDEDEKLFESIFKRSLRMLLEQEEEGGDEAAEEPADDAASADSPSGSEAPGDVPPANKDRVPDLDIDAFTQKIARLVMNHRNLLRIEDVIINRAKNFLDENYGDAFVSKYLDDLQIKFGIETSEFPGLDDDDDAPYAIGANPAGAGISGGG